MANQLSIVYFSWVRERIGRDQDTINCPENAGTIGQLLDYLKTKDTVYQDLFADLKKLRFALDQDFVGLEAPLGSAKELAIFPPVTGG